MTQFIAEVSSNHQQDLQRCHRFIEQAAAIGCDAVKFQLFRLEQLFAPEILARSAEHRARKDWELPLAYIPELAAHSREQGLQFGCTPFYLEAVEQLEPHADFYKIASYELTWDDLLATCGSTGRPVVLSTGMADLAEVSHAVEVLRGAGCDDLTLLHCVSAYPARVNECNLKVVETLRDQFACKVGWSDHTVNSDVINRAINHWQADLIEFHLDLEGEGAEFSTGHCWLPEQIAPLIQGVTGGGDPDADGDGSKAPVEREQPERAWRADPEDGLRPFKAIRADYG